MSGVQVRAGGISTTTSATGAYTLTGVTPAASVVVTFDLAGYAPQARTTEAYTSGTSSVLMNVPMVPVASTQTFDPAVAQTLTVPGSTAMVTLPANALQTASGVAATGTVTVKLTPIAPGSNPAQMPGNYMGVPLAGGAAAPIESFGAFDVRFTDAAGAALNLAPGVTATVRIPVSSRAAASPATAQLFSFNPTTGLWYAEGTATLLGTAPNQYYEGSVSHFATWNSDQFYLPFVTYTGCVVDAAGNRVAGATVSAEGINYSSVISGMTNATGDFMLPIKTGMTAIVQAVKDVRVSNSVSAAGTANTTNPTCLVLSGGLAVRLTWGASPSDLDSHTLAPGGTHVYFGFRGSLTAAPYIGLDVDDTTGYGPEVTTFSRLAPNSTYRFYVHNWSNTYSPGQTGSPARVELLIAGSPRVFTPPSGEGTNAYWHVFDLTTNASCGLSLTAVQQFRANAPTNPNAGSAATYCP